MENRPTDPANAADATDAPTDADLVRNSRAGQAVAFESLTRRHFPMVFAIAYARLASREAAEDLAQEVFLRAYLHLAALTDPARFAAWLARIARNEATSWLRQSQSASRLVRLVPLDDLPAEPADPAARQARAALESDEETRALRQALFELPADQRELVMLHYFEGLNNAEIAERLDVHRATVGRQIEKALKTMKRSLEPILRRAAPAFRHSGGAAARTLAVVGALSALSAPAKAALLAQAGVSTALAAAGPTATVAVAGGAAAAAAGGAAGIGQSLAAAWHAITSAGLLLGVKGQIAAGLAVVALLSGGVVYQLSKPAATREDPNVAPIRAALAESPPQAAPVTAAPTHQPDLIDFLVQQNEVAWKKIATASYRVEFDTESKHPDSHRVDHGSGEVQLKGDWRWSTYERLATEPDTGWEQKQSGRVVLNDHYLGYWPKIGNGYAYQADHRSIAEMDERNKVYLFVSSPPDLRFLQYCFRGGEDGKSFNDMRSQFPDVFRWEAQEAPGDDGRTVYQIMCFSPFSKDTSKPENVWVVDPNCGFLITRTTAYNKAGDLYVWRETQPEEVAKGVWFPVRFEEKRYGDANAINDMSEQTGHIIVSIQDLKVNLPIPDEQFQFAALGLTSATTVFKTDLDDATTAWVFQGDLLVPRGPADGAQPANVGIPAPPPR